MSVTVIRNADWAIAWDTAAGCHVYRRGIYVVFDGATLTHVGPGYTDRADRTLDGRNRRRRAIGETERRRRKQLSWNEARGITPKGVSKRIKDLIDGVYDAEGAAAELKAAQDEARYEAMSEKQVAREIRRLEKDMIGHARNLEFEKAAKLRDQLAELKKRLFGVALQSQ